MSAAPATFIDLDEPAGRDPGRCGNKAAMLAQLRAAGVRTPPGLVVPADVLDGLTEVAAFVPMVATEIRARFGDQAVAVRSSASGEDGIEASFAGLFTTVLGVSGADALRLAIEDCLAAASAAPVETYSGGRLPRLSILIQPMVQPEAAGVAFTADPVTGDRDLTRVSAVRGLGDRLVSGTADPDEWEVRGDVPTRRADAGEEALEPAAAIAVAGVARSIADRLGTPQDVEWALVDGEVVVLQARPITALPSPPAPLEGTGWSKDRAHYAGQVTAFGGDLAARIADDAMADTCKHFGLLIDGFESRVWGGEMYSRPVMAGGGGGGKAPPAIVLGVLARVVPGLRRKSRAAARIIDQGLLEDYPRRWNDAWRQELADEVDRLLGLDLGAMDDAALAAHGEELERFARKGALIHFRLALPYFVALHEWTVAAEELLGWDTSQAVAALWGRSPASSQSGRDMDALRQSVAAVPGATAALAANPADPVSALASVSADLGSEISQWIRRHGWRTTSYDAGSPTIAERPALLTKWLSSEPRVASEVDTGLDSARAHLSPPTRARLDAAWKFALLCYPQREDNVILTDDLPSGLLRRWLLEAATRLVGAGRLDRVADGPFLLANELRDALRGNGPDLRAVVARRRGEWAWARAHPGPERIGPADGSAPDLSRLPTALRRINRALLWAMEHEFPSEAAGDAVSGGGLTGAAGSPGRYWGPVRVVMNEMDFGKLQPGDVLVAPVTSPAWAVLFPLAGALVTDGGGVLSHAAIVAREHGIPAVLGTGVATRTLRDGVVVEVDGTRGVVVAIG